MNKNIDINNSVIIKRISVEADGDYENCVIDRSAPEMHGYMAVKRIPRTNDDEFDTFDDEPGRSYSDTIYIKEDKITSFTISEKEISKIKGGGPYLKVVRGMIIGPSNHGDN